MRDALADEDDTRPKLAVGSCSRTAKEDEASFTAEQGVRDERNINLRKTIHLDGARTGRCEINDPAIDVGTAIIDPHHRATTVTLVRYAHERTERQRLVGGSQGARVDLLAIGGQLTTAVGIRRPVDRRNPDSACAESVTQQSRNAARLLFRSINHLSCCWTVRA